MLGRPQLGRSRSKSLPQLNGLSLAVIVLFGLVGLGLGAGATYACHTPLDLTKQTNQLPDAIATVATDNRVLFTVHRLAASALDFGACSPTASGLQWLKAAAHGSDPASTRLIVGGLERAATRSPAPDQLAAELCGYLRPGSAIGRQRQDLQAAGLGCPAS